MNERLAFVLMAKNEQATIGAVISDLRQTSKNLGLLNPYILVADDSSDQTPAIARAHGAEVVAGGNLGLGRAYITGLKAAASKEVDYIFTLDSDGQTDFDEISDFIATLKAKNADMVVGSRFKESDLVLYRYPRLNRLGIHLLSTYLTVVNGQRFTDSHGGIRVMRRAVAEKMEVWGTYTYVQETIVDAVSRGFRVVEIASRWHPRQHGGSRVLHSIARYARKTSPILFRRLLWSLYYRLFRRDYGVT